ncbi:hypothetical protein C0584_01520 [Candidatus Parcubacteria bacterium]|nr:MAG: hypothetical protein C0584_01520 [Candidatus Parcubacteria bacterium]
MNIGALVLIFGLIAYLLLSTFSSPKKKSSGSGQTVDFTKEVVIEKKYKSLKKINSGIFEDPRYKELKDMSRSFDPDIDTGNKNPFEVKEKNEE